MSNPILLDLDTTPSNSELFTELLNQQTQVLIANMENEFDSVCDILKLNSIDELYDRIGEYLGLKSFDMLKATMNTILANEQNPIKLKIVYDGPGYIKSLYQGIQGTEGYRKHSQEILKSLVELGQFPNTIESVVEVSVLDKDTLVYRTLSINESALKKQVEFYKSIDHIIKENTEAELRATSMPPEVITNVSTQLVERIIDSVIQPNATSLTTPTKFHNNLLNANYIAIVKDDSSLKPISKVEIGDLLVERALADSLDIDKVISQLSFE